MSDGVFLAAWMAATLATGRGSPFGTLPARMSASVAGETVSTARALAVRRVKFLAETSRMENASTPDLNHGAVAQLREFIQRRMAGPFAEDALLHDGGEFVVIGPGAQRFAEVGLGR